MASRDRFDPEGCGCLVFLILIIVAIPIGLVIEYPWLLIPIILVAGLYALHLSNTSEERKERREREAEERRRAVLAEEENKLWRVATARTRAELMSRLQQMSGLEFERFMAEFLKSQGYSVEATVASGDQGVDLLLNTGDRRIAVQLKRYARPLSNKPVQEALAGMFHYKADEAWVIATSSFTRGGMEAARSTGVRLIDGHELIEWLREASEENQPERETSPANEARDRRNRRGTWLPHPDDPSR